MQKPWIFHCLTALFTLVLLTYLQSLPWAFITPAQGASLSQVTNSALRPLQDVAQITAGAYYTCALTTAGGVKCWGRNDAGQLGDSTLADHNTPFDVSNLSSGVSLLASGGKHSCALVNTINGSGSVKCWGWNLSGQLGDGTQIDHSTPTDVVGLGNTVTALAAGGEHTCALTNNASVMCWGWNGYGQLGDGTLIDHNIPTAVVGLDSPIASIRSGYAHTCALTTDGSAKCWGRNDSGQLGIGTTTVTQSLPTDVLGLGSGITAIAAGDYHTCALTIIGGVKCWGANGSGQLGDGTTTTSNMPVDVVELSSGVMAIEAGESHTCAVLQSGGVKCWGDNGFAQLGDGTRGNSRFTPTDVVALNNEVSMIAMGNLHSCALLQSGTVKCWGHDYYGQIGDWKIPNRLHPVDVTGLSSGVSAVSVGNLHTCALTASGSAKCWGANFASQLGNGSTTSSAIPIEVNSLSNGITAISAGAAHTCALTSTGGVKCWGYNYFGQLGNGSTTTSSTPIDVSGLSSGVVAISAGTYHTCALTTLGGVKCWGNNSSGQLGNGSTTNSFIPSQVIGLDSGIIAVATGLAHTCALTTGGGMKCWGAYDPYFVELAQSVTPTDVRESGISAITAGPYYTCFITTIGIVNCWGMDIYDSFTTSDPQYPDFRVDISSLDSDIIAIGAGYSHTCALTMNKVLKCWGRNNYGQLGNDSSVDSSTPVTVSAGITAVSAGITHTCAITEIGGVKCWGANERGQIGDGGLWRTTPVDVVVESICYTLTLAHTGSGGDPIAYPGSSSGCNLGTYTSSEQIAVVANPAIDWHVSSWNGTNNDTSTAITNTLIMPASNYTVSVNYTTLLTPTATSTLTPTASPTDAPTPTSTNTSTVTPTSTSTVILTATATPTATPIDTSSAVSTPTFTPTTTPTNTSTSTPTFTSTPTSSPTVTPTLTVSTKALVLIYAVLDNNLQSNWNTLVNNVERGVSAHTDVRLFVDGPGQNDAYIYDVKHDENDTCPTKFNPICGYTLNVDVHKGDESSAHPTTLTRFITESVALYPTASQFVVALVGHGSGWSAGVLPSTGQTFIDQPRPWVPQPTLTNDQLGALLWDDHPSTTLIGTHSLSIKGLDTALYAAQQITNRTIDLLYLDGCSLGMLEIAYEVKERARYMIASPNTDWATFTYDRLLTNVNPTLFNVRQLSEIWLQTDITFIRSASSDHPYPYTYALTDLTQIDQISKTASTFADALIATLATDKIGIAEAFTRADHYESDYNGVINGDDAYTDLNSFAFEIEQQFPNNPDLVQAAKDVQLALSNVVASKDSRAAENWQSGDLWEWKNFGGLGIYLPLAWDEVRRFYYNQDHIMWAYDTTWDAFLTAYYQQPLSGMSASESARAPRPLATCELTTDENCNELAELLPMYKENQVYLPLISR